jgi:dTDP-4-amino-4,6-dideoxygalactose transaminase
MTGALSRLVLGPPPGLARWIAERYGVDAAVLVDSGTSALRVVLESIPAAVPRRVALPAYGCYDLVTAAVGASVEMVFYDIDSETLGPDWASLSGVLAAGATAVVVAHQYGVPVDLDRARALCDAANALLVEDAAQGTGGWWQGRRLGAWGDAGILSFGRGKGMSAGGGGAVLLPGVRGTCLMASAPPLLPSQRGFAPWLKFVAQSLFSAPALYAVPARLPWLGLGDTPFHDPWAPRSIAWSQAGALPVAAELADVEAATRRKHAAAYQLALRGKQGVDLVQVPATNGAVAGWLRFPVILEELQRHEASNPAFAARGVMPGYPGLLPALQAAGMRSAGPRFPGAERLVSGLVTFPAHRWVGPNDLEWFAKRLG